MFVCWRVPVLFRHSLDMFMMVYCTKDKAETMFLQVCCCSAFEMAGSKIIYMK